MELELKALQEAVQTIEVGVRRERTERVVVVVVVVCGGGGYRDE